MLQFVVSVLLPAQGAPSVSGAGLSQVLSRVLVPPSQETEHSDHSSQELQPPFTKTTHKQVIYNINGVKQMTVTVNYGHHKMADMKLGKNLFCRLNCFYNVF